jgi:ankyrin repeat protein
VLIPPYNVRLCQNGLSPLMLVSQHGHEEIVRMLLKRGANANAVDVVRVTVSRGVVCRVM